MSKRLDEIQFARAFAMLAVLFVHFSSIGLIGSVTNSPLFFGYGFFNSIGRIGVPVFFLLSGLVLFYSYNKKPFTKETIVDFYKKRLKYIVVPYIVVSIFYFVVKWFIYYDYTFLTAIKVFINEVLNGQAHMHLYFLFILIQFYLVFPIILYVYKKVKMNLSVALIMTVAIQFIWVYLNKQFNLVENRSIVFLTYFSFFAFGGALGMYYYKIQDWWDNKRSFLTISLSISFLLSLALIYTYDITARSGLLFNYVTNSIVIGYSFDVLWTFLGISSGLFLIIVGKWIIKLNMKKTEKCLHRIAQLSFGIYLIHPFFLMIFVELLPGNTMVIFHGWQLVTAVCVTILSWVATVLISRNKYGWLFIGK